MIDKLRDMIVQYVEIDKADITGKARFIEDLGFNSYDFMTMVGEIEEEFGVTVDEREIVDVKTVDDALAYIGKLQG